MKCARCGAAPAWTIWGVKTCLDCRGHWDAHAPTALQVLERARETKTTTEQVWTGWTQKWLAAGIKARGA